ncbi:MAG TPA: helix-turn-helix domain-containing protein [Candidatus Paceibacterota bacterium]|nr:helix-turn-helix domain-containing protein [Candidatus Paceibacterota bacterium]
MATADLKELKPVFLNLIDLIRSHRIKTLGKTTPVHVPKKEVDAIAAPHKLRRMFDALVADGILGGVEVKGKDVIFNNTQTAEQILAFRRSLIIEGSLGISVDDHGGSYYDMYRNGYDLRPQRLSDEEGKLLYYLVDHADTPVDREELATLYGWTVPQISSRINTIRRKLTRLGFSNEETMQVLPSYLRGKVVFRLV